MLGLPGAPARLKAEDGASATLIVAFYGGIGLFALLVFVGMHFFGFYGIAGAIGLVALIWLGWAMRTTARDRLERAKLDAYQRGYGQARKDLAGKFVEPEEESGEAQFVKPRSRQRPSGLAERS